LGVELNFNVSALQMLPKRRSNGDPDAPDDTVKTVATVSAIFGVIGLLLLALWWFVWRPKEARRKAKLKASEAKSEDMP
jgi:hypothetical protein